MVQKVGSFQQNQHRNSKGYILTLCKDILCSLWKILTSKNQIKLSENWFNLQTPSENSKIQLTPIVMITLLTAGMIKIFNWKIFNWKIFNWKIFNWKIFNWKVFNWNSWATILERQMQIIDGIQSKASDMKNQFRKKFRWQWRLRQTFLPQKHILVPPF